MIILACGNDGQFVRLCEAIGHPEWATDERFAVNPSRARNVEALTALLRETFGRRSRDEVIAALDTAGVPCGPINTIPEVFADPQVRSREMLRHIPHPSGVDVPQVASPLRFAGAPLRYDRPPPLLGEHTDAVLRALGYGEERIAALRSAGIV
jgi:crotonobetainyl-CoA:carnitine CoA-transferase CaiB-like acyl-CoA transferase